jgi:hypothetical protein
MGRCRRAGGRPADDRVRDDAGGVWIVTGWVVGLVVYAGVVLTWHAGFSAAAPFVVIPAVLVVMIGAGNLISGRRPGRPAPRYNRPDPVPIAVLRDGGRRAADDVRPPVDGDGAEEPPAGEPGAGR